MEHRSWAKRTQWIYDGHFMGVATDQGNVIHVCIEGLEKRLWLNKDALDSVQQVNDKYYEMKGGEGCTEYG